MKNNKIFILTAAHNNINDTKNLLKSIFYQTFKRFDVVLVDDGSTDGSRGFVRKNYPSVSLIKGEGKLWWTGSLNLGLKKILKEASEEDFVWTINNDCIFGKTTLARLMDNSDINSIIGSKIFDPKTNKVWDRGVRINWTKLQFSPAKKRIDALSTKGTLFPVKVFKDIGLFDARHFPHYFSDYEFTIRAKRAGYKLLVGRSVRIYNKVERTGIETVPKSFKPLEIFKTLFSKKSKINLPTQINIIKYVCPPEHRFNAYLLLISKLIHAKR